MGIEGSREISGFCNRVGRLLSLASFIEASVPKPGNAGPTQDIPSVRYRDLLDSAMKLEGSYQEACLRGYHRKLPLMDLLYKVSSGRFALLGTAMLLLPLAYSASSLNLEGLIVRASQVIRSMGREDWKWFSDSLSIIQPSYLGRMERMDYRSGDLEFWRVLEWSATFDTVSRELMEGYRRSLRIFQLLRSNRCGSFTRTIQHAFIRLLSEEPDGLILRKWGSRTALNISLLASKIPDCPSEGELEKLNRFLISRRINPGSTADLIASGIALYELNELFNNGFRSFLQRGCDRVAQ
ncbi:hypothetical protein L3N51_02155 [Metallosphaera sp. J1]|uniref:triphosphoribosyl-dephospho-CoA synthase n=1 Tax=Metallosphaera javensis (ex Hofmann et al. 2022) TaxID=99938 RepID=UPI001EDD2E6B|nr:triphosphoribosyl-dephospho-CoA synthase [Metallosphaera javensis (ex Hofmann et al. 2022)]MCG3109859.1 hypothetical protein [Metallosphaera javensis (ex Hofmann et al. 2022)]